jgi:hypothetical protein
MSNTQPGKPPLFRKVNTTAHGAPHRSKRLGFDIAPRVNRPDAMRQGMGGNPRDA